MDRVDDDSNVVRRAKAFHMGTDGAWKEACAGLVDVLRSTGTTSSVMVVFVKESDPTHVVHGYRLDDNANVEVDPSVLRIVWYDPNFKTNVAIAFQSSTVCHGIHQKLLSFLHVEKINFASQEPSAESLPRVVGTIARNMDGRAPEILEELLKGDYWAKALALPEVADESVKTKFVRQLIGLNCSSVLQSVVDNPILLSSVFEAVRHDRDIAGCRVVDHATVFAARKARFTNPFSLSEESVSAVHRLETVLYLRECVFPSLLDDLGSDAMASLLSVSRDRAVTTVCKDPCFTQGITTMATASAANVTEERLAFVNGLLQHAKYIPESSSSGLLNVLYDCHFGSSLVIALRTLPRCVSNILTSFEQMSILALRKLLVTNLPQHNSALLSHVIRIAVDPGSGPGNGKLFTDVLLI